MTWGWGIRLAVAGIALAAMLGGLAHAAPGTAAAAPSAELVHVVWRTALITSIAIIAVVALGFSVGMGERSYLYLAMVLGAQLLYVASTGGELRFVPWLGDAIGGNPRTPRVASLMATIGGFVFVSHYLKLRDTAPDLQRLLAGCLAGLAILLVVALFAGGAWLPMAGNALLVAGLLIVLVATVRGMRAGQRPAMFLLLCLLPMFLIVLARVVEIVWGWSGPGWLQYALPASFALSALLLTIGLTDSIQQLRHDRDRANQLATFDALTGALSRPAIEERFNALVDDAHRSGRALSMVFFDIDRFKSVNDDHGHRVGDGCLRVITLRVRNRLRTYDLLGRWGGDELMVLLPDTRLGEALGVAENLRSAVNCRPLSIEGLLFDASLSLGVAELAAGETADHFLERADAALYASKSAGRDRVTGQSHPRFIDPGRREPPLPGRPAR